MSEAELKGQLVPLTRSSFRVTMADTDAAGVIFFGAPALWTERILSNWLVDIGAPLSELLASGYGDPVVHVEFRFRAPLRLDDEVTGILSQVHRGRSSLVLHLAFARGAEREPAVEARLTRVRVRLGDGPLTPVPLDGALLSALEAAEERTRS